VGGEDRRERREEDKADAEKSYDLATGMHDQLIGLLDGHPRCGWINRQTGRKTNFFNARQPEKTSMPKDMRRVYS
jgi:hypothetical protein